MSEQQPLEELVALAAQWAELGVGSVPIAMSPTSSKIAKLPATYHGVDDATTDPDRLLELFEVAIERISTEPTRYPEGTVLGIGVRLGMGGFFALDYDTKNDSVGRDTLDAHLAEYGDGLAAASYTSVSGATNLLFRKSDPSRSLGNTTPWKHVDARSDAGYIVPPGVRTPWGEWKWAVGDTTTIPTAPSTLESLIPDAIEGGFSQASDDQVEAWLDAGGSKIDRLDRVWLEQSVERIETAADRHPTMFEIVRDFVHTLGSLPDQANRRLLWGGLRDAWDSKVEPSRSDEIYAALCDVLGRVIGQEERDAELGSEGEHVDARMQKIIERAEMIEIDFEARELVHARRIAGLSDSTPLIGVDAIDEWLDGSGDRCLWGDSFADRILLPRGESLGIVAREGCGKSTIAAQIARAALGGVNPIDGQPWKVLGYPIEPLPDDEHVVYLALDRPRQLVGLLRPMFEDQPASVRSRLITVRAPALEAVKAGRAHFLEWLAKQLDGRKPGLIVVDSLKDVMVNLSSAEEAGQWHAIRTSLTGELDCSVIELHHMKKKPEDAGNDAVFGSALISAGLGSIIQIHGRPGDDTFLVEQTKMPAVQIEPLRIKHHYGKGDDGLWWTEISGSVTDDLETAMMAMAGEGFTTADLVDRIEDGRKPAARKRAIEREIAKLAEAGKVVQIGHRGTGKRPAKVWSLSLFVDLSGDTSSDTVVANEKRPSTRGNDTLEVISDTPIEPKDGPIRTEGTALSVNADSNDTEETDSGHTDLSDEERLILGWILNADGTWTDPGDYDD